MKKLLSILKVSRPTAKPTNLKEVIDYKIEYSPVSFQFNNVGSYKR